NTRSVAFASVPSYYAVLSTKPVDQILPVNLRQLNEIGVDALKLNPTGKVRPDDVDIFRAALIQSEQQNGLFGRDAGQVDFLGQRLFRATIAFPATVPTGTYSIEIFLV